MVVGKFYISIVLKMYFIVINDLFTIIEPRSFILGKSFRFTIILIYQMLLQLGLIKTPKTFEFENQSGLL